MELLIDGKKVRLNPYNMKYSRKLRSGSQVDPYVINDEVYKFYKRHLIDENLIRCLNNTPEILTKEKCSVMNIPTDRILLPRKMILNKKHKLVGYIVEYIDDLGEDSLFNLDHESLIEELKLLKNDLINVSDRSIKINDMTRENIVFHNGIYLIDPGSYMTANETSYDSNITLDINNSSFNSMIVRDVMGHLAYKSKSLDRNKVVNNIEKDFRNKDYYYMSDYLIDNLDGKTLGEFVYSKGK